MVPGGRARALQGVDGAPKEEAEDVHAGGHGDVPEVAAGHVPRQSAGGGVPPVLQMGAAVGETPHPVDATQEQPQEQIYRRASAADHAASPVRCAGSFISLR